MQSYIDSSLLIVVKKIEIIHKVNQNENRSELLAHFGAKEVRYRSKYTIFSIKQSFSIRSVFHFFSSK